MRYDQLYNRCPALCDRYIPLLRTKREGYCALQSVDSDPFITADERAALTEYATGYQLPRYMGLTGYVWCDVCQFMVGFDEGSHVHCPDCAKPTRYLEECNQCYECCNNNCLICTACETHTDVNRTDYHHDCECCNNCCECDGSDIQDEDEDEDEDNINNDIDILPAYGKALSVKSRKDKNNFTSSRLAGVEWEYNNLSTVKQLNTWTKRWGGGVHYDASCGEEAVTPPMAGDYISKVLTELGDAFKASSAKIDERCSVHVHVDASDYSWFDMYKLLRVYSKVEPLLYLLAGQQRLESIYCVPVGKDYLKALDHPDPKGAILSIALKVQNCQAARLFQRKKPNKRTEGRRKGLNINPWLAARRTKSPDATVEFRIHRNTSDANRVIGWTKLCVRLVEWCANASDKEINSLPNSPLRSLCKVIAPDCADWILSRIKGWRESTQFNGKYRRRIHIRGGKYEY